MRRGDLASALSDQEMWKHQVQVWTDSNLDAQNAALHRHVDVASTLSDQEMWKRQMKVWEESNLVTQIAALNRHIELSEKNAAAMRKEIKELRDLQAQQEARSDWRRRENWPRLIGQRLGGLV